LDKLKIVKDPLILDKLFNDEDFKKLKDYLYNKEKTPNSYDKGFGRYAFSDSIVDEYAQKITPFAREVFNSDALIPSYSLFAHYEGEEANLWKHVDDNACTYTIDMCVYQSDPWDLWVEGKPYSLEENQALAYYGNDQMHWREDFPKKDSQHVAMIFFHFVEPDHWYFTKGQDYLNVLRNKITEEEWEKRKRVFL